MRRPLNIHSLYHGLDTVHLFPRASILHLQGCQRGRTDPCRGCANAELWSDEARWLVDPAELAGLIIRRAAAPALSVSGGEPLDQYEPLCLLFEALGGAGFSLLMWTGFEMGEVRKRCGKVLTLLDVIVTGPYREGERIRGAPFLSSANQEISCLTERARRLHSAYPGAGEGEIVIPKDGSPAVCLGNEIPWR